jgi:hypothetical protein
MRCRTQKYHVFRKTDTIWDKSGIAGQFHPICAPRLGNVEFSLANPQVLAHQQGCQLRVFSPNLAIFRNQVIFR